MLVVYFSNSVPCEVCLCSVQVRTFDFKWLRGVHREAFTGAHVDNVYMGRGTQVYCRPIDTTSSLVFSVVSIVQDLLTMWVPLGDVSIEMGTLALVEGSHSGNQFKHLQVQISM